MRLSVLRLLILAVVLAATFTGASRLTVDRVAATRAQSGATPEAIAPAGHDAATHDDPAFQATFRHEFAQVEDVLMHYVVGGDGPPLVLLHGWPQTWYGWIEVMPALAAEHTVLAVDLPGLGDSVGSPPSYDKETLARYVHGLIADQLGYDRIDLVGHDLGAGVAYQYAAQFPSEVRRFVFMDYPLPGPATPPTGPLSITWHFGFNAAGGHLAERLVAGQERVYFDYIYDQFAAHPDAITEEAVAEFVRTYSQPEKLTAGFQLYRALPEDVADNLASARTPLPMPVLVITGQRDLFPGFDWLEGSLATVRPVAADVRGVDVLGAGHWVAEEQPEAVAAQLLAFLADGAT